MVKLGHRSGYIQLVADTVDVVVAGAYVPSRSADEALTCRIRKIHQGSTCTYDAKCVALDLADGTDGESSEQVPRKKVGRLLREAECPEFRYT